MGRRTRKRPDDGEAGIAKWTAIAKLGSEFFRYVPKWGSITAIAYFGSRSVESLAGRLTQADIAIGVSLASDLLRQERTFCLLAAGVGLGGIVYGKLQASLRKSEVARLAETNRRYERRKDPNRSSSGMTARGERPEGDE